MLAALDAAARRNLCASTGCMTKQGSRHPPSRGERYELEELRRIEKFPPPLLHPSIIWLISMSERLGLRVQAGS
jgi:hypothetical protein